MADKISVLSYSLYFLHQNIGIDINLKIATALDLNGHTAAIIPLATLTGMTALASFIHKAYEKPANR